MFDDVFEMATSCADSFQDGVRDSFGASIIAEVLDPIRKEIDSLRAFNDDFRRQAVDIDRILQEAQAIQFKYLVNAR